MKRPNAKVLIFDCVPIVPLKSGSSSFSCCILLKIKITYST
jgi:hypothetical protein